MVFLTSCSTWKRDEHSFSPDDLVFKKEDFYRKPKSQLESDDIKKDIDLLIYALDNGYGARNYISNNLIQTMFKRLEDIKKNIKLTENEFCKIVGDALWEIPDGHLTVRARGKLCGKQSEWLKRIGRVGKNYKANYYKSNTKTWFVGPQKINGRTVGFISIISFPNSKDPVWNGFIEKVKTILKFDEVIIDLRGNRGGDDTFGFKLAELLQDREVTPGWDKTIENLSPETIALSKNNFNIAKLNYELRKETVPSYVVDYLAERDKLFESSISGKLPKERVYTWDQESIPFGDNMYKGKIIILADRECGSSGESSLEALAKHPNAKFYGENTAGKYHFGNVSTLILPQSKINIGIASKYNAYNDNRNIDKIGLQPDVITKPGMDAINFEGLFK